MNLGQLARQKHEQFGKWEKLHLKGLSWLGGSRQPGHCDLAAPWHGLALGWFTRTVELPGLLAAMEEAEGTELW